MKLKLHRTFLGPLYTIGKLYIDDVYFCDTLEDVNRDINKNGVFDGTESKVYGDTCIPYGVYKVIINMSKTFKRRLPLLLDVPSFEGIRIHKGNTTKDTLGCILVGENKVKGQVINSTVYEVKLMAILEEAIANKESIEITIL